MSTYADGSVVIETDLDSTGFQKGSEKMNKAMASLHKEFDKIGEIIRKGFAKTANMERFDAAIQKTTAKIAEMEAELQRMGGQTVSTAEYESLAAAIAKAEAELLKLTARSRKMEDTGVSRTSRAYQSLQYDIADVARTLEALNQKQLELQASGGAAQLPLKHEHD